MNQQAIAQARGDALGILGPGAPQRIGQGPEQALQVRRRGSDAAAQPFHPAERALEVPRIDRLEQVVDRVHRERVERVLFVRGRENDDRLDRQARQHLEAIQPRHLDVEETDVGRQPR